MIFPECGAWQSEVFYSVRDARPRPCLIRVVSRGRRSVPTPLLLGTALRLCGGDREVQRAAPLGIVKDLDRYRPRILDRLVRDHAPRIVILLILDRTRPRLRQF